MEWLKQKAEICSDMLFINDLTYSEVYRKVDSLARKLAKLVEQETRVALYANNSVETLLFIQALLVLKKEILMLNANLTQSEVAKQIRKLDIHMIFSENEDYLSFQTIAHYPEESINLDWRIDPEQTAVIMNTSATSGEFKSVAIKWKQIISHVQASAKMLEVKQDDNWLLILPVFHIGGLAILFRSMYNGTQLTIMKKFSESVVIQLIHQKKITMLSLVPTMFRKMIDAIEDHHLRVVLLGGEYIPDQLIRKAISKQIPLFKTYGMTEHTSQITTFNLLDFPEKIESVGRPLAGVNISIQNKNEQGIGEIWIKSPMLMDGYLGQSKLDHHFFNTKDIGYFDADGFMYVVNRRDDVIISGGENIYPKEIEDLLYELPGIEECAVVKKEDSQWGQVPVLYLVSELESQVIETYLRKQLAKYKLPKQLIYLDELPKNATGKINKKELSVKLP